MSGNKRKAQFDADCETPDRIAIPPSPMATERHPEFYFDDSLVVIQVESTLFRVHEYQLTKSETFSDMFNLPKGPTNGPEEGASPENPIVLRAVKASDFEALLKVLYADHFPNKNPKYEPDVMVPALRLAHMWNFSDLRSRLLSLAASTLGPVDRITLARELDMQEWLVPAYMELWQREESLTLEEGSKLGMHHTILITRWRDQFHQVQLARYSGNPERNYCKNCAGVSYGSFGATECHKCFDYVETYYRYTKGPPSPNPFEYLDEIESEIRELVEDGSVTE